MQNKEELTKHLVSVIDEAIAEIEELKKSKFDAQEIKMEGPGGNLKDGHPTNGKIEGKMGKEEDAEKADDEDEDKDDAEKADGKNNEADSDKGPFKKAPTVAKGDDEDEDDEDEDEAKKADGKNNEADKDKGPFKKAPTVAKADKDEDEDDKEDKKEMKKSFEEQDRLLKSYVDEKVGALEGKISQVLEAVKTLADQPMDRKGVPAHAFKPLAKGADEDKEIKPLTKSEVSSQLFELKKSGKQNVLTDDIVRVETGNQADIQTVAKKYGLIN